MSFSSRRSIFLAVLGLVPGQLAGAQTGAKLTGPHANEPFCKTTMKQYEVSMAYMRASIGHAPDPKARDKFFNDQRAINILLAAQAPGVLKSDIALINKDADASFTAQAHADQRHMLAAMASLRTPAHIAAAKRVNAYCGVTQTK
jgi:hypothetical protein